MRSVDALMGAAADKADVEVPCNVCGKPYTLPGYIYESVRLWNHEETESARLSGEDPNYIRKNEIAACEDCTGEERERRNREHVRNRELTDMYLRDMRAGRYSAETLAWLRENGRAKEVDDYMRSERGHGK